MPVNKVRDFEVEYLHYMETKHPKVLAELKEGKLSDEAVKLMEEAAKDYARKFKA